jgi:hypothetical protein
MKKILEVVSDSLSQVAITIETFYDLSTLMVEEVVGRLHQALEHQRKKKLAHPPASSGGTAYDMQGRLLLSHEEWISKLNL